MIQLRKCSLLILCLALSACHYNLINPQSDDSDSNDKQPIAALQVPTNVHMVSAKEAKYPVVLGMTQADLEAPIYPPSEDSAKPSEMVMKQAAETVASANDSQSLTVHHDLKRTWVMVATALKKSGYRILDQDQDNNTFYILDVRGKGKALNEGAPIYCVVLNQKENKMTQVALITQDNKPAPMVVADQILGNINSKLR